MDKYNKVLKTLMNSKKGVKIKNALSSKMKAIIILSEYKANIENIENHFHQCIINLKKTYDITEKKYNINRITNILLRRKTNFVHRYKELIIENDNTDLLFQFYTLKKSRKMLMKLKEIYSNYIITYPNYTPLIEQKEFYLYKNIYLKQKLVNNFYNNFYLENLDDPKKNKNKSITENNTEDYFFDLNMMLNYKHNNSIFNVSRSIIIPYHKNKNFLKEENNVNDANDNHIEENAKNNIRTDNHYNYFYNKYYNKNIDFYQNCGINFLFYNSKKDYERDMNEIDIENLVKNIDKAIEKSKIIKTYKMKVLNITSNK